MKQFFYFLLFAAAISHPSVARSQDVAKPYLVSLDSAVVWEAGMSFTEIRGNSARMFSGRFMGYLNERVALGFSFGAFSKKTADMFDRDIERPQLNYEEVGLYSNYLLLNRKRLKLGAGATLGGAFASVADRAVTEEQTVYIDNGDGGYFMDTEVPKTIVRNNYLHLKPELVLNYFFNQYWGLHLSGGYNLLLGKSKFASTADFDGWQAKIGVVMAIPSGDCRN